MPFAPVHLHKIAINAACRMHALVGGFHRRRARLFDDELLLRDGHDSKVDACALIAGEPLPVLAALVAGTHASPSRRGRFELACAAFELPPQPSADGEQHRGRLALHLAETAARLSLLRDLLVPEGLLCVRAEGAARVLAGLLLNALCGANQRVAFDPALAHALPLVYRNGARPVLRSVDAKDPGDDADAESLERLEHADALDSTAATLPDDVRDSVADAARTAFAGLLDALPRDATVVLDADLATLGAVDVSGRRWFACSSDPTALLAARKRLVAQPGRAVLCQQLRLGPGRGRHTAREMATLVLALFGAEALPLRRGRSAAVIGRLGDTFVFVDAPGATTTQRTIDWVLAQRARAGMAQAPTVVLGWRYAADVALRWHRQCEPGLELRAIPPALLPRLARGGDLRAWRGTAAFPGLGQPLLAALRRERDGTRERLQVSLRDYVLCAAPGTAPGGLGAIEFWSIDADFDGVLFRSVWHCARRDGGEIEPTAELTLPRLARTRRVALRLIDIHGQRTELAFDLAPSTLLQVCEPNAAYGLEKIAAIAA